MGPSDELLELPARIAELDARLTERLDRLAESLDRLAESLDRLAEIVARQQDDVGTLKGELLESRVRDRSGGYLAPVVRKAVSVLADEAPG